MAAAVSMKLSLAFVLLLSGLVVFGEQVAAARKSRVDCSLVRCIQGGYITCDNYPYQKLEGCICDCAPRNGKNCKLHLQSGSTQDCGKEE
ncbi:hypothetical protein SEVIR_9G101600v4 [Setaria viridis]|uniref:Uncharacterized protein n=2 Tax=Setaria TaxID=4554 RepID=K4AH93_SETIT|nr:uncharacterized protein LOC101773482 [Setaria italica]XP_034576387.1 uncharacterized protein LOC117840044 [Setaria viridis]RCV41038.1 hypothetical protein SETIT_9G103800v2 [Setaria italica]TKV91518.1 hypothetical protein SEVIR_9G101600v2 [Setaria viridis]